MEKIRGWVKVKDWIRNLKKITRTIRITKNLLRRISKAWIRILDKERTRINK